jgi:uncharacterized protein YjbJ (UPF0337 family)
VCRRFPVRNASTSFEVGVPWHTCFTLGQWVPSMIEELNCMSFVDKAKNKVEDLGGQAKEAAGKATDDKSTENEGKVDQGKANLKDAGEKVKDAFK